MKLTLKIAKVLVRLIDKEIINSSLAKSKLIDELVSENILLQRGKHHKTLQLINENGLHIYLENQLQINNLKNYISTLENKNSSRADFVKVTTDSKNSQERTFKGFLVNCYIPIEAELNGQTTIINPTIGSFVFIYDFESFKISNNITIVGIENPRNFRHIEEQKYLFENLTPLFVSRYPQNQNKDFIKWLKSIQNNYLHFGDFDISGIGIYINEYKKHLLERAFFFIPNNIEISIRENGNRERYNIQKVNFKTNQIKEKPLLSLIELINTEQKGLDQEFYINQ